MSILCMVSINAGHTGAVLILCVATKQFLRKDFIWLHGSYTKYQFNHMGSSQNIHRMENQTD